MSDINYEPLLEDLERGLLDTDDLAERWSDLAYIGRDASAIASIEGGSGSPHGHQAVVLARGDLNTVGGSKYQHYFNHGNVAWCALFVSWAMDMTGNRDHRVPWDNPAYVPSVRGWAEAGGHLVRRPLHGDMFGSGGSHMGLVAGANEDGSAIYTVEGNWGNKVVALSRSSAGLWFARMPD